MKNRVFVYFLISAVCLSTTFGYDWSTNPGNGSAGNPYQISTPEQLISIGSDPNLMDSYFILTNDIVFDPANDPNHVFTTAVIAKDTDGSSYGHQGPRFAGRFDGQGNVIYNLRIERTTGGDCLGLFGYIYGATITNLYFENVAIQAGGGSQNTHIGSLAGYVNLSSISNCYSTGLLTGEDNIGGLCGSVYSSTISQCYTQNTVSGRNWVGGLCGYNMGTFSNCYAAGSVQGYSVGGFCGFNAFGIISNCYSTGLVRQRTDSAGGGFCDQNWGEVINCYWDKETSGMLTSSGGQSKTTAEMKQASTFMGWNDGHWTIDDGYDYPRLRWQNAVGSPITTDYPTATYSGLGSYSSPFILTTAQDVVCMSQRPPDWNQCFVLANDIDMAGQRYVPPVKFSGTFDGNGFVISNLTVDALEIGNRSQLGFLGIITNNISNLGITNVYISGEDAIGGICGYFKASSSYRYISNCYTTGFVTGSGYETGGLVGDVYQGKIERCFSSCAVTGYINVGGLVGSGSKLTNCYSTGPVVGNWGVGGLCGELGNPSVSNCFATGSVTGTSSDGTPVREIGGLAGSCYNGTISTCYSTGMVTGGSDTGGLFGDISNITLVDCFWDMQTSGMTDGVGSEDPDPAGVTGLETTAMMTRSTFTDAGWDFTGTWAICDDMNYPRLQWYEKPAGDFACPDGVGIEDVDAFGQCWLAQVQLDTELEDDTDAVVSLPELARIGEYWLAVECGDCGGMDVTGDGEVTAEDLSAVADDWLAEGRPECGMADLNGDDVVDLADWAMFAGHWMEGR